MYPILEINLAKLKHNTEAITKMIKDFGGITFAVTKVVGGEPEIGQALLAGGARGLADSRISNIIKLRQAGITAPILLLRSAALSEIKQVISLTDISLNSEKQVLLALNNEAVVQQKRHGVILMTDLGDGREGVSPDRLVDLAEYAKELSQLFIYGIGTNLACFSGETPTLEHMRKLVDLSRLIGNDVQYISGGNSSGLYLLTSNQWDKPWLKEINHWRIGESIFLGCDITTKEPLRNCYQDVCMLKAEVIEVQEKAVANYPKTVRIVVALGRQEIGAGRLYPSNSRFRIIGTSSDHLVLVSESPDSHTNKVGSIITFALDYQSLLATATSPYVTITFNNDCL